MSLRFMRFALLQCLGIGLALASLSRAAGAAPNAPPAPAPASDPPSDRAGKLRDQGNEAMLGMRYSDALVFYKQAMELAPDNLGLLYSIARADQFVGEYPDALAALDRFAKEAPPEMRAKVGRLDELFAQIRPRVAVLDLKCDLPGARVIVREKVIGTTPLGPTRLVAGAATVQLELDGFFTESRDVVLPGGGEASLTVELHRKSTNGLVSIRTEPIGAHVFVDGREVGTSSPKLELALPAGPHDLLATRDGYDNAKVPVVLASGATRDITLTMDRSVPLTSKWWFWTGAAVIVAGGIVTTYALLTEKSAQKGTLAPGQIAAPLVKF
jgi:tetratricopeptide (TPR) repeat protein